MNQSHHRDIVIRHEIKDYVGSIVRSKVISRCVDKVKANTLGNVYADATSHIRDNVRSFIDTNTIANVGKRSCTDSQLEAAYQSLEQI
jgi:hypothetical protein